MTRPRRAEGTSHAFPETPQASRNTSVSRALDEDTLRDASLSATEASPVGFVCPPCGRFVRTDLDGVILRPRTGSKPRFCSPGCRQAAYRRRRAGVGEDAPLQHRGGAKRSLSSKERSDDE
jgi:hypothetical protein